MSRKYPKLPNGFGSIKKLSGKRTNPYAVYPPVTEFRLNGSPVTPKALAYVSSWIAGFIPLRQLRTRAGASGLSGSEEAGRSDPGNCVGF